MDHLIGDDSISNEPTPTAATSDKVNADPSAAGQQKVKATQDGTPGQQESSETEAGEETAKPLSAEELDKQAREALGLSDTEPQTIDYLRTKAAASAKEAKGQVQWRKGIEEFLAKEKGLKIVQTNEGFGLVPNADYVAAKANGIVPEVLKSLTKAELDLGLEKPEELAGVVARKVFESVVSSRLEPTTTMGEVQIPDAIKPMLTLEVAGAKDKNGKELHPDYQTLEPFVDGFLADPAQDSFREWMNQSAENFKLGKSLVYGKVHVRVAPLIAAQEDAKLKLAGKKAAAETDASLTQEGTLTSTRPTTPAAMDKAEGDEIVGAKEAW
jgi:hypothetical protein